MADRKYRVALSYQSDRSFLELVSENLTSANYSHNSKRSRVVSVRQEFIKLLSGLYKDAGFDTMHELFITMAVGNYHIESKLWQKFINGVANAVGFGDLPTAKESVEIYGMVCSDFESNNRFISADLRAQQEAVYTKRQEANAEVEANAQVADEPSPEVEEEKVAAQAA